MRVCQRRGSEMPPLNKGCSFCREGTKNIVREVARLLYNFLQEPIQLSSFDEFFTNLATDFCYTVLICWYSWDSFLRRDEKYSFTFRPFQISMFASGLKFASMIVKFLLLMPLMRTKLENWHRSRPRVSFYVCPWPCKCDHNPRLCASCVKVKMATKSGKTTQTLPLKGLTGKQCRQA